MSPLLRRTPEPPGRAADIGGSDGVAAVLEAVAAALGTGAVLLDGHDVVLANDIARSMRVVRGSSLVSASLARLVRQARRERQRVSEDVQLPWGASTLAVRVAAAPVDESDRVVLLLRDLTEQQRIDAVRRDFVANVSHELKTPVGALLLLAEAMQEGLDDPATVSRFAARMAHEAGRLSRLVQELLDLSRLQGGEPVPAPGPVKVAGLFADAADRVRLAADRTRVEVTVADPGDLMVWGDERSLVTALTNLLDNAVTYSSGGTTVGLAAAIEPTADGSSEVAIAVKDDGMGIPAADLDRVFERFYRVDAARSRATGGTGLGLAIVKHIASNSGGRVSVWSAEGVGSTFTLHLPLPPEDDRPLTPSLGDPV